MSLFDTYQVWGLIGALITISVLSAVARLIEYYRHRRQ